jgi:hypothetical protein
MSLLTAFFKVFENVTYARLYQHLSKNYILLKEEYGFRSNSSTELASFKSVNWILLAMDSKLTVNWILLAMDSKLTVGGIVCDMEKAFDYVNHDILLCCKPKGQGVQVPMRWIF